MENFKILNEMLKMDAIMKKMCDREKFWRFCTVRMFVVLYA